MKMCDFHALTVRKAPQLHAPRVPLLLHKTEYAPVQGVFCRFMNTRLHIARHLLNAGYLGIQ